MNSGAAQAFALTHDALPPPSFTLAESAPVELMTNDAVTLVLPEATEPQPTDCPAARVTEAATLLPAPQS